MCLIYTNNNIYFFLGFIKDRWQGMNVKAAVAFIEFLPTNISPDCKMSND